MKKLVKILLLFLGFLLLASLVLYGLGYEYIFKGIRTTYLTGHKTAFIDDYPYFNNHVIQNSEKVQEWPLHKEYNEVKATPGLDSLNQELETAAFLIIKNDSIWFEKYYNGYSELSKTNSFFNDAWKAYQTKMEAIQTNPFKDIKSFSLD